MHSFFGIFSILSLLLNLNEKFEPETIMIINIFRHGARTPKNYIPEIEKVFSKYPTGSLTDNGWRMQFLLGKYLKKRIPKNLINKPSDYLLISSFKDRAINSGISFASGFINEMFEIVNYDNLIGNSPPCGICKSLSFTEKINSDKQINNIIYREKFKYPPIKKFQKFSNKHLNKFNLMIVSREQDILFHGRNCNFVKSINYDLGKKRSKKFFSDITFEEHEIIYNYLKEEFPIAMKSFKTFRDLTHYDIKNFYLILRSLEVEKPGKIKPMNSVTESAFYKVIYDYYYKLAISSNDQARMTSSMFFDHVLYFFDGKVKKNKEYHSYNVVSYSGHDYNILGLINNLYGREFLSSLDKSKDKNFLFSSYSSSFEFHLIKTYENEYYVKIYYNGNDPKYPFKKYLDKNGKEKLLKYNENYGVKYKEFKEFLKQTIFPSFKKCFIKSKISKRKLMIKILKIMLLFKIY